MFEGDIMKSIKRFVVLILLFLVIFTFNVSAFAASGDNPPTLNHSLPYYTSKTKIYEYVYTARKFKPASTGNIYICFTGVCSSSSPATTVTWKLQENVTCSNKWSYSLNGSNFPQLPQVCITGCSTNKYYHGYIQKNNPSIYLTFKWGFGRTASEAADYTY